MESCWIAGGTASKAPSKVEVVGIELYDGLERKKMKTCHQLRQISTVIVKEGVLVGATSRD